MLHFSLRFLFTLTAVTSFGLGVLFTMPQEIATTVASIVSMVVIPVLAAGAVYCIGYTRAFCIGALLPLALLWVLIMFENKFVTDLVLALLDVYSDDVALERTAAFSFTCGLILCGIGGVIMRWVGQRQRTQQPGMMHVQSAA